MSICKKMSIKRLLIQLIFANDHTKVNEESLLKNLSTDQVSPVAITLTIS